ncbi:MAG: ABC transporter ATP-binding protein [Blautia sp.]|nr:ABC transporter ATP-binding protein [Blautia sp.]
MNYDITNSYMYTREYKKELDLTYLFISHQLQITQKICDHIAVLYLGSVMELGTSDQIFFRPLHPYTEMLVSSILEADPDIPGLVKVPEDPGRQEKYRGGCKFAGRCPHAKEECFREKPGLFEADSGHLVSCFRYRI